jgi:hypothetical protein
MREKQASMDDLSAERPPKREGSADSFPVMTDDQAENVFRVLRKIDSDVHKLTNGVLKVLDRDVDQERSIAELKAWRESVLKEANSAATKTSAKYTSIGTALGVIILAASSVVMQQCRWLPPGIVQTQQTPTPK